MIINRSANLFTLLVALLIGSTSAMARADEAKIQLVDRIVAVINSEVITQHELGERLKIAMQQLSRRNIPLPPREILEKQLLERLITERLQLQFAKETGLRVDDTQLDKAMQRIAEQNKLSMEDFRAAIERDGSSYARFREEIRNEIILVRLREREVDNKTIVTDSEVDNFINTRTTQLGGEEEFNLEHILVRVPEQASPEQVQEKRARAEQALSAIKNNTNFAQVAASYSDAADAMQGGQIGWRTGNRLPALYVEALTKLHPGEHSAILRSPNGFHILKLIERRGKDTPLIVQQTHARHILVKTNETVSETDAKQRLAQIRERLDNGGNFAELARQYSEDGSATKGGDVGWLSPGDTVPEFERAMDALQPGQFSQPVHTPFGWHMIEVLERRQEDVGRERQRLTARKELRERKSDEGFEDWLRQLRDRTYVEIRLEEK
ncbi:MAG: peptidylprolyl isomerase [Sulfuricellaceae bacterium]